MASQMLSFFNDRTRGEEAPRLTKPFEFGQAAEGLAARVNAPEHCMEMIFNARCAAACTVPQRELIMDDDPPALGFDQPFLSKPAHHARDKSTSHSQHLGQLLVREFDLFALRATCDGEQPLRGALHDRVRRIARSGLEQLRENTVRIT